jgi:outer membrane protein TolC
MKKVLFFTQAVMRQLQYITLFLFFVADVNAQSALSDYLTIAEQNNPGLKAKQEEFEAAMQKIPQVSALADPELSVSSFGQMVETRVGQQMARLSLSQMFPWFGTLKAQRHAAALSAQAIYESYLDRRNALNFNVRAAYYSLYELDQSIRLQEENLEILSTYKTLATTRFQNGSGKLTDALRVEIMINDLKTEINILTLKRKPLQTAFNNLLNRPADEAVIVPTDVRQQQTMTFSLDSMLTENPRLGELDRKIAAAQAQELVALKQGMPRLGLGFEYIITARRPDMTFEDNGRDAYMPMLTVSLPVYRKKYKAAVSEAKHMQQSFVERKTETENLLNTEYEMAIFERNKSEQELNLLDRQAAQTQQVIDLLLTGYGNSGADFEEVLRMQQMLLKYEMDKVSALKDYCIAEAKLIYLVAKNL